LCFKFIININFLVLKSIGNIIESYETGQVSLYEISERYYYNFFDSNRKSWVKVSFITGFEECFVYTKKGTNIVALKKLEGQTTFPIVFDLDGRRLDLASTEKVVANLNYNNEFNCHGFTFLNSKYWFILNQEKLNLLISENNYTPCTKSTLKEGGICMYYNFQNELIHSGKVLDGIIQSKFGINPIITRGEQEIAEKYDKLSLDISKTRYFNLS